MFRTPIRLVISAISLIIISCASSDNDMPIETPVLAAIMELEPENNNLSFEPIAIDFTAKMKLTIRNIGDATLEISKIEVPVGFSLDWSSGQVSPEATQDIYVTFAPTAITEYKGDIVFITNTRKGTESIASSGEGLSTIYEGDISLISDEEIENFAAKGFTQINGELCLGLCGDSVILPNEITSLLPLSRITEVNNFTLKINTGLTNLNGIEQMVASENIVVWGVTGINNIDELAVNTRLIGTIVIFDNENLENVNGLTNITELGSINIVSNPLLTDLDGLNSLVSLDGFFTITENSSLIDFCSVTSLFQNGYSPEPNEYRVIGNVFNPTVEDLTNGICGE